MRRHQGELLGVVLDRLEGVPRPLPSWSLDEVALAGLATGLTALLAELTEHDRLPDEVRHHLDEQSGQVAARVARFRELVPRVADALAEAQVPAVFVKGAALLEGVWLRPLARPMADVDVVVPSHLRAQAGAALERIGCRWWSSTSYEDAYLAWGDGGAGRRDGESAAHNGRVEVHPGWCEHLHGYDADGFDVVAAATADGRRLRLDLAPLTAQALGHLGACVVRGEVRAVNVVDVWWCHRAGVEWARVGQWLDRADPRLSAPAVWLVDRVRPGLVPSEVVGAQLDRLPRAAVRSLASLDPDAAWRDPAARTTIGWRQSFAQGGRERARVMDQAVWAGGPRSPATLLGRVRR